MIGPIGDFLGAPLAAWFADIIGRKYGILITALPTFLAWMILAFANSTLKFCIGRFISGIGEGIFFIVYPMYVGEVTEPKIRGVLGCTLSVSLIIGTLAINSFAPFLSIRDSALVSSVFPIILVVLFYWMPESPCYLLMKGKSEEAAKSLYFLRRCNTEKEIETLKSDVERQMSERGIYKDLFCIDSNRKALLIMIGIRSVQQLSGISAWGLFTQTIFIQAGGNISPIVSTLIYLMTQLILTILGSFLVDKYGRRPLLILSCLGSGIALTIGGIYFYLKEMTEIDITPISWVPILVMVSFIIVFGVGMGTVPSLMLGELFSASIKGKALCIMCIYNSAMVSTTSMIFSFLSETFGMFAAFFVFGGLCFINIVFCYYFVPETKGKSLEDIQQYLKGNKCNKKETMVIK